MPKIPSRNGHTDYFLNTDFTNSGEINLVDPRMSCGRSIKVVLISSIGQLYIYNIGHFDKYKRNNVEVQDVYINLGEDESRRD